MNIREIFSRLVFVRKCVGCREILSYGSFSDAFCPLCELAFRASMTESCPICLSSGLECRCMPSALSKSGAIALRKLTFYDASKSFEARNKLIYFLKRNNNARVVNYCAKNLVGLISEEIETLGLAYEDIFVLNVPRSRSAISMHGHDQSALIAKALASRLGVEYLPIIKRKLGGKEQKKLSASGRVKNAKTLFRRVPERKGIRYKNRSAILFDDVVTSGASMAAVSDLLRRGGVKNILCVCLSMTPEKMKKSKTDKNKHEKQR